MTLPIQIIHIHYQGKLLILRDSDDKTPLYTVKVCRKTPQMTMTRSAPGVQDTTISPEKHKHDDFAICTASFKGLKVNVDLTVRGRRILLNRQSLMSTTYDFDSVVKGSKLFWEADGALSGDFRLVDERGCVVARFRNKLFSNTEVGALEMVGVTEVLREEIVISGLAMLAMVQSMNLCQMVFFW